VDFCLGFYKHPHPQIASDLLVSGRLYLAVATCVWPRAPRAASLGARLAQEPEIRLVGDDPMRQAIDEIAQRLGSPAGPGIQVQTSRLALELVRLGMGMGMGWTVVYFLTATRLDPAQMVAMELPDLPPIRSTATMPAPIRRGFMRHACSPCCRVCCTQRCHPTHAN